jgi:two-component system, NtrC family, sensor kinase
MKLGFRSKIYIGTISLVLLLGAATFGVVSRIATDALLEENHNRGLTIGVNLAAHLTEPILAADFLVMKTLIDETAQLSDDISYTFVLDESGEPLVHTFKGGFPVELKTVNPVPVGEPHHIQPLDTGEQWIYDFAVPVQIGEDLFGTVRLGLTRTRIQEVVRHLQWSASALTGLVLLIAGFVAAMMARSVTRRISILHESSQQVLRGNLDVQTARPLKKNCWEIMDCTKSECPAHRNTGHRCWYLAGTLCSNCVEGDYAKKISTCRDCVVYRRCSGDEIQSFAESFDSMTLSLNTHLSELETAQQTLAEQRQLLRTILDATPDFVSLQDRSLIYIAANQAFCSIMGRAESEIIGRTNDDLFAPRQADLYQREDRAVLTTGRQLTKENMIRGEAGERWLHVMKIPVRDADGRVTGILGSCRDITAHKEMQELLNHAQKMETVGRLTAGIAHEINTPLGIILGYSQLLLEDVEGDSQIHVDLQTIVKQTEVCRKIVSDLLGFSRHTESTISEVDLNRSIAEVVEVLQHTFNLDNVTITSDLDPELPMIQGDQDKLKQVLANLLGNAHDAIGTDGTIHIQSRLDVDRNEVVFGVVDTGTGIEPRNLEQVFDPFYTTKPVDEGTGLGLSVTFGIVREHGGTITVESPPVSMQVPNAPADRGALFVVHLPVKGLRDTEEKNDGGDSGTR